MVPGQLSLLGHATPEFDRTFRRAIRRDLAGGAWVEYVPNWLEGHEEIFEALVRTTHFRTMQEHLYDKIVAAPRLVAALPEDGPGHPILEPIRGVLSERYGEQFVRTTLAYYRDGNDSVAWHGDRVARRMDTALVATLSVGGPRRFLVRPYGGGASTRYQLGWGDLFVMGGSCQRLFQHSVPKVAHAEPRIAIMYRPQWEVTI